MVNIFSSRLQNTKNLAQKLELACSIAASKNLYDVTSGVNHILRHIAYMFVLTFRIHTHTPQSWSLSLFLFIVVNTQYRRCLYQRI